MLRIAADYEKLADTIRLRNFRNRGLHGAPVRIFDPATPNRTPEVAVRKTWRKPTNGRGESARGSLRGQCGLALVNFPGQDDSAVRVRLGRASAPEPAGLRNVTRTDASFANAVHPKLNILPCRTVQGGVRWLIISKT
jgi:hypothetical protein